MNIDVLLPALIAVGIMLLIGFPVHEFCHALAAYRLGDSTARYQGRLTLNPFVHFDPIGGGMLALSALISQGAFFFGYAKPTPVNPYNLQGGRRGEALVAAAGPLSNLVMAALAAIPFRIILGSPELGTLVRTNGAAELAFNVLTSFLVINVFLFIFNLIPIPPLDGWRVLLGLVDARTSYALRQVEQYALVLIVVIFLVGGRVITPIVFGVIDLLVGS